MILDVIGNRDLYLNLNENFKLAFDFLMKDDLLFLAPGKHIIKDDSVFALVSNAECKMPEIIIMESHRKFIDIHYIISGEDKIGWIPLLNCEKQIGEFNDVDDYVLYNDQPIKIFSLIPKQFALFFPTDVHAPLLTNLTLHKIVLKVSVKV